MDVDPLSTFQTPRSDRRKGIALRSSIPRYSDLLAAFGARRSPSSLSRMERRAASHDLRAVTKPFSYAESSGSDITPHASPGDSNFGDSLDSSNTSIELHAPDSDSDDDGDELNDDVINVAPRRLSTRELPKRSTRSKISYATPKKATSKKTLPKAKGRKANKSKTAKLTSDISSGVQYATERQKVRNAITQGSKRRRDAFLRANADAFLPLLPDVNYITKLHPADDQAGEDADIVTYETLESEPLGVTATMKPYQLEGLSFLVYMYRNGVSAILGDEMGLGKTLQTLSLFQFLTTNDPIEGENRPFLVVCPLSVLSSWMNESKKWVPGLHVVRFHGPKSEREKLKADCRVAGKAATIDVIVTTYETFVAEQGWFKRAFIWRYCVLDEGHKIKNSASDVSQALHGLKAEHRLLLTGTPLQNNLLEMWALLHWLYDEVFTLDTADSFRRAFDLTKGTVSTNFMDDARRLLELVMLRRMKTSPGVNLGLPPKEEVLLYVPLTPMQRFWYTRLLTKADSKMLEELFKDAKSKEKITRLTEAEEDEQLDQLENAVMSASYTTSEAWAESKSILEKAIQSEAIENKGEWRKLMNLVLQLRKVCSHPYILPHAAPDPYYLGDHIKNSSGKFIVLDKLVNELVLNQGKKIIIFAGLTKTLDLCEDLLALQGANAVTNASFRYVRFDGSTSRARRNLGIRMFNTHEDYKVMLISTRAGGLGINLASATNVVFMDEDWNPQVTLQAEARAHRIGQTQKVTVFRLCSQGTVEEQMLGRIRKKLYLSTKITESMRNIHSEAASSKKRKRESDGEVAEEEAPQLDTTSLKSLLRRGAQTLARPAIDVTEMLEWDWETTLAKCQDKPAEEDQLDEEADEESWLNTMEKVECAVFEGKKHQKELDKQTADVYVDLNRADRRVGKNTTVMMDGFAINKESLNCGDWEAVPTFAGKDPRLQEPTRAKKAPIQHQDFCQCCQDGGALILCSGCPRTYHTQCLDKPFQQKVKGMNFYCPQHECVDCQAKTSEAGGMLYRCRWCEHAFCEDCLDWESTKLIGDTLMEYEMLGFESMNNAYYIECPACVQLCSTDAQQAAAIEEERVRIQKAYEAFVVNEDVETWADTTPATVSEVGTPVATDVGMMSKSKKLKTF